MTATRPFVSVIIPTHNRSTSLSQTVGTFMAQSYPVDRWELILVDNKSTDDTWDVITRLSSRSRTIRGLREPRRGAHFARNSGAVAATGEILYFTDDDMLADPHLLERIVEGFDADPGVASVTGRVLPRWDTEPPRWVLEHCRNALLSLNDLGESLIISDDDPGIFSCHQAVKREVFMKAGGFNPDTNAGLFTGDNETGLNIKIRELGYRFAYVGTALTHHMIPAARMTQRYLNSRLADQGFCDSYTDYRAIHPGKGRLARRIVAHSALTGVAAVRAAVRRVSGDSAWRLDLARVFYHRNRVRYDARLIGHHEWREFALRDDWISEKSTVADAPR
ncbi:MAG: glycosyltransferase family 2 protein [Gemmatimonadaceae bacterium]